jgi:hypothetical protein
MAKHGKTPDERARGRHNFCQLARKNPNIAKEECELFGYEKTLRELTPEILKQWPFSLGKHAKPSRKRRRLP